MSVCECMSTGSEGVAEDLRRKGKGQHCGEERRAESRGMQRRAYEERRERGGEARRAEEKKKRKVR